MSLIILIMVLAAYTNSVVGLVAAFLSGIILDIWDANPLGESSLIFLVAALAINLYKRKFNATSYFFLITAGILTLVLSKMFEKQQFLLSFEEILQATIKSIVTVTVISILLRLWGHLFVERKLSV